MTLKSRFMPSNYLDEGNYKYSRLVISTSMISNNHISRKSGPSFNVEIYHQVIKYCDKRRNCSLGSISPLFRNISIPTYISNFKESNYIFVKFGCAICIFLSSANLICRSTDISKCFRGSLRLRDNGNGLYSLIKYL